MNNSADTLTSAPIDLRDEGRIAWLTLTRPEVGNALNQELAEALVDAVRSIRESAETRVVVLGAAGKLFCAGGDVSAIDGAADQEGYLTTLADTVHRALAELRDADVVVVAAVQGSAAGGGLGVVLNADLVIASTEAKFMSAYSSVGLSPDCGVTWLLPAVVGPRRAMELTLTGRVLAADEAAEWGIVTAVVEPHELDERVRALAESLARGPVDALVGTRHLINSPRDSYTEHLAAEVEGLAAQIRTEETRSRIHAFAARQKPR